MQAKLSFNNLCEEKRDCVTALKDIVVQRAGVGEIRSKDAGSER